MAEQYEHLQLTRLEPVNQRRSSGGFMRIQVENPVAHASGLLEDIRATAEQARRQQEGGFDPRLLLKLEVEGLNPQDLESSIAGMSLVSQEERSVVVVFATAEARADFEQRLRLISRGQKPRRQEVLLAIKGVDGWGPEDRKGNSLKRGELRPEPLAVDVELWPLERGDERRRMLASFKQWCTQNEIQVLDTLDQPTVLMARVRLGHAALERLLNHRDVRLIELPPQFRLPSELARVPLADYPTTPPPPAEAPRIAVIDSGLVTNHPFLAPAVGEAVSFIQGKGAQDENGHGTMVAGIALYGDVAACANQRLFVPTFWILSGRITDENNEGRDELIENQFIRAVDYFVSRYNCRIFNVSVGNVHRPYVGSHVGPWASVLDTLALKYGVLFVVSAGNFTGSGAGPSDWSREYPGYLFSEEARIIDPAPALNVLSVGSVARYDQSHLEARYPNSINHRPIARYQQPSPFTRTGPSVRQTIKPEVVEFGGNWYVDPRVRGRPRGQHELGEISTAWTFAGGNLLVADSGTSFAAPRVAHLAGQLQRRYPNASTNLIRALIVAHAHVPDETRQLFEDEREVLQKIVGYGQPDMEAALHSSQQRVTLVAEYSIAEDRCHFYELPVPEDFLAPPSRRPRHITVALAHTPAVRRTRIEYKCSEFSFRVIRAPDEETVARIFRKTRVEDKEEIEGEVKQFSPSMKARSRGTVQAATWEIRQISGEQWRSHKLYVVVTRRVPSWALGEVPEEDYALTIVLEDKHRAESRLYSQLQARLRTRVRQRSTRG